MNILACDFETTTNREDCRVWAWAAVDIDTMQEEVGIDLPSFMNLILRKPKLIYFHNLKFDGNFILYWLLTNGYEWTSGKDERGRAEPIDPGQFTTLISDMGSWYSITIQAKEDRYGASSKIEIRDSLKIIPTSIDEMPKTFGLQNISKLSIDYKEERQVGHELTDEEREYVLVDARILALALKFMLTNGQKKLTTASNAMHDFKTRFGTKEFNATFPKLRAIDDERIRKTYKGGWTYVNPIHRNKQIGKGCVYDVNSMYPWAMKYCLLPYGEPVRYHGEPKPSEHYPLYTVTFDCEFKLKPGKFPSIQLKNTMGYMENEYIESSNHVTELNLTSIDFELFKECYDYEIFTFKGGYYFKGRSGIFAEYIDYWFNVKTQAKKDGNKGLEKIAKLMLNALYGKFGARMFGKSKVPVYDNLYDIVRYKTTEVEERRGGYVPVATFITSYSRDKIIRGANSCGERFIYGDTDSLHIIGTEPVNIDIDDYRLGAFKQESIFVRAKFIRQKTYLEIILNGEKEEMNLKACGMPSKLKETVREEDFYEGAVYDHNEDPRFAPKLKPTIVPGGVILEETTFRIKSINTNETSSLDPREFEPGQKVRKPLRKREKVLTNKKKCGKMEERG